MFRTIFFVIFISFFVSVQAKDARQPFNIKWQESAGGIINSSVCYTYKKGSIDYRECRSAAKEYFKKQCHMYKEAKLSNLAKRKFCLAANTFNPINL